MPSVVNLSERLSRFDDRRSPKVVGRFDGHDLMPVKAEGGFVRHAHPDTGDPATAAPEVGPRRR